MKTLKDAIANSPTHPRHHGVKMQAHHVISELGLAMTGLAHVIVKFGYDINDKKNLVFIPCTLQGACHLGVQPHRGDHSAVIEGEEDQDAFDDDSAHEVRTYHTVIRDRVKNLKFMLDESCSGQPKVQDEVCNALDGVSSAVLGLIQKKPNEAPLTNVATYFQPGNPIGCAGVVGVGEHEAARNAKHSCKHDRDHRNKRSPKGSKELIKYEKPSGAYKLKVGN